MSVCAREPHHGTCSPPTPPCPTNLPPLRPATSPPHPQHYYRWTGFLDAIRIDWSAIFLPSGCYGGFDNLLLTQALVPLCALAAIPAITLSVAVLMHYTACKDSRLSSTLPLGSLAADANGDKGGPLRKGLFAALPLVLFASFLLCGTTSSSIFRAWDCVEYESGGADGAQLAFLRLDPSLRCWATDADGTTHLTAEYSRVRNAAIAFVAVWPVGLPLLYLLLLIPQRKLLRERHTSALSRATTFLHAEYEPSFFFWEPLFMWQRSAPACRPRAAPVPRQATRKSETRAPAPTHSR